MDYKEENNNFNVDLDKLIQDNSDILSKPSDMPNINNLSLEENSHKSKSKKKENKKDKSDEKKHKSDKKEKHREKRSSGEQNHSSLHPDIEKLISQGTGAMPALPGSLPGGLPSSLPGGLPGSLTGGLPGLLPSGVPSLGLPEIPNFLGMPSPLPDLNSYGLPGQAGLMPPFLGSLPGASMPGLMGASMLTPPPPLSNDVLQSSSSQKVRSLHYC